MRRKSEDDDEDETPDPKPAPTHPFDRMMSGVQEERQIMDDQRFEDGRTEYLLRTMAPRNSKYWIRQVRQRGIHRMSDPHLTFQDFNEEFPGFPYVMGASRLNGVRLHVDPKSFIPATFKAFRSTPFMKAFESFYEKTKPHAGDRGVGLVFPRKGIRHGMIVTDRLPETLPFRGLAWVYYGGMRKHVTHVYVLLFQSLAEALHDRGRGWSPGQ